MTPLRLPRRPPAAHYETMTPLINVAFLLMAFFMLIGRMDATAPFVVLPPQSAQGTSLPQGGAMVSIATDGAVALDGASSTVAAVVETLAAERPELVRINAHAEAPLAAVLPLVAALEARGVPRIVLVVTPP